MAWLDAADDAELAEKHRRCLELQTELTDTELLSSLQRMIRQIEQERLIRVAIADRSRRRQR